MPVSANRNDWDLRQSSLPDWGPLDLLLGYISMSASSISNQAHSISVVIAQLQELHSELRLEVANRDDKSLNWTRVRARIR
jgi:hypothetical protein